MYRAVTALCGPTAIVHTFESMACLSTVHAAQLVLSSEIRIVLRPCMMAACFRATTGRPVQNKFCREVAILRSCRNSNIVQFQGACVDQGATMLVTEFMEARFHEPL